MSPFSPANFLDAYTITPSSLVYVASRSLLPPGTPTSHFRGDTLLLTPSTPYHPTPLTIFATTRGSNTATKGYLSAFSLDSDGLFADKEEYYETPTSGGKAHALDLLPKAAALTSSSSAVWVLLTDDDDTTTSPDGGNGVRILEWDGWGTGGVKEVVGWPGTSGQEGGEKMNGGSHAIWLD